MDDQNFDLEFERIIEEEFGTIQRPVTKSVSYEEEFETKKKLIESGMKALFICILMLIILVLRFTGAFSGFDMVMDAAILIAALLSFIYIYAFIKKIKKK